MRFALVYVIASKGLGSTSIFVPVYFDTYENAFLAMKRVSSERDSKGLDNPVDVFIVPVPN